MENKKPPREEKINAIYEKIAKERYIKDAYGQDVCVLEVMIGDVVDYMTETENLCDDNKHFANDFLYYNWKEKRKPIEDQSDECVDFIYQLISE